jgi:hypothetical protein
MERNGLVSGFGSDALRDLLAIVDADYARFIAFSTW